MRPSWGVVLAVLATMAGGCGASGLAASPDGCSWNFLHPLSSGRLPALFDYSTYSGCIGPTPMSTDFGFNIELHDGDRLTRFDFGVSGFPPDGTVRSVSDGDVILFASANGWACTSFDGTATFASSNRGGWSVRFDATCLEDDGTEFSGTVSGNTENGYAVNGQ